MPRPKRKFKSLDDELDDNIIDAATDNVSAENEEINIEELVADEDTPADDTLITDKEELVQSEDGESVSISVIRRSPPPKKCWADGIKTKFTIGDLVYIKGYPDSIFKIIGPSYDDHTYSLKPSGSDGTRPNIPEDKLKLAKPGAIWKDYWDTVSDPYRDWKRKQDEAKAVAAKKETKATKKTTRKVKTKTFKKNKK
jgi:hypothetical protein